MYVFIFWNPKMAFWKTSVKQQAGLLSTLALNGSQDGGEKLLHDFPHKKSKQLPPELPYSLSCAVCMNVFRSWNPYWHS